MSTWVPPVIYADGDPLNASDEYAIWLSLANWLSQGIPASALERDAQGRIVFDSDIDLSGRSILGAANAWTGVGNIRNYGVQGQGAFDESDAIESGLNRMASKGLGLAYFPAGRYNVTRRISVPPNLSIRGSGPESIIRVNNTTETGAPALAVQSASGVTIQGLAFENAAGASNTGILVIQSERVTVRDCYSGPGMAKGVSIVQSKGCVVDTLFANSTKTALDASGCTGLSVYTVNYWVPDGGIYPGPGVSIVGSTAVNARGINVRKAENGVLLRDVQGGSVQGYITDCLGSGVVFKGCRQVHLYSSLVFDCVSEGGRKEPGVMLESCDHCTVANVVSIVASIGHATFGVQIEGGTWNRVHGIIGSQNFGTGDVRVTDDSVTLLDRGQNTLEYGNAHYALGIPEADA